MQGSSPAIVLPMKRSTALARRTPLVRRSALPRRRGPIRSTSEQDAIRYCDAETARRWVRDRDGCCVRCGKPGVDAHHRLPRGRGGARRDPSQFALSRLVWLCRDCHHWTENHRLLALGLGLLVRHGATSCSQVPVYRHRSWVLLTDEGLVIPTGPRLPADWGDPGIHLGSRTSS